MFSKRIPARSVQRRVLWLSAAGLWLGFAPDAAGYNIRDRWTVTQTDGGGIQRGDPVTIKWSFVPDGENWSRGVNSDLIAYLDDGWNVAPADRIPDLTNRAWWFTANEVYEQYQRVSGLTLIYTPELLPDGSDAAQFGDIRIGGGAIDGPGGILANNTYPNGADMKVDTSRDNQGNVISLTSTAAWRNVVSHESGHGVGLGHTEVSGANAVMEANLQTSFWGLQFDDVYAFNRLYGDPLEKNGGNDSFQTATDLGDLTQGNAVSIGMDADDTVVEQFDDDWLGIDGNSDIDYFRFSLDSVSEIDLVVTPMGPTYTSEHVLTDFTEQADLNLTLYNASQAPIATADNNDAGDAEAWFGLQLLPGDYVLAVDGEADLNQFYSLELTLIDEIGLVGDLDADGDIDGVDLSIVFSNFTGPGGSGMTPQQGDLDGDGDVDGVDLSQAFSLFTGPNTAPVPEPASAISLGGLSLLLVRRRLS